MSGSILPFGAANYAMMTSLVRDSSATRQTLATLSAQAASGDVAETYAGLGAGASTSLDLSPEIATLGAWQANISAAQGPMQVTQTTLTQISQIATNFNAQINTLNSATTSSTAMVAQSARQALEQVANLLDSTDGNDYVFSGQDSANPPVPDPNGILSSGFFTAIQSAVAGLATGGAAATSASVVAIGASNSAGTSPFSSFLSQTPAALSAERPVIQVGSDQFVPVGILASANADAVSSGPNTTGSYMRDIMTGLAALGSLSASSTSAPDFQGFLGTLHAMLGGAVSALNQDAGVLGNRQTALTADASTLSNTADALKAQVGAVQDVDMASTASELSLVQTQLQASYQVISDMGNLSLVNYL